MSTPTTITIIIDNVRIDLPERINWVAQNQNGGWYGFPEKPQAMFRSWGLEPLDYSPVLFLYRSRKHINNWKTKLFEIKRGD